MVLPVLSVAILVPAVQLGDKSCQARLSKPGLAISVTLKVNLDLG